jgi:hypothetical protein
MVVYECKCCNYITSINSNYNKHTKTKKHRVNSGDENTDLEGTTPKTQKDPQKTQKDPQKTQKDPQKTQSYECDYCNVEFSTYAHKRRHELHRCKENDALKELKIKKLEKEKKTLKKEKNTLKKEIEKMMNNVGTINNTTNNNTNNNTNNIIVVNNYGKENTDYLTADKIRALLARPYESIQELIKMLHFNSEHPENHNVKITNKKEPYALVWNNPIWEIRKKKSVVKDIVDKGYMMIDTTHDNMDESNKKYIKFQTKFDDDATHTKDTIEEDAEMVIINETKKLETAVY